LPLTCLMANSSDWKSLPQTVHLEFAPSATILVRAMLSTSGVAAAGVGTTALVETGATVEGPDPCTGSPVFFEKPQALTRSMTVAAACCSCCEPAAGLPRLSQLNKFETSSLDSSPLDQELLEQMGVSRIGSICGQGDVAHKGDEPESGANSGIGHHARL
jgi:hypothetical protein